MIVDPKKPRKFSEPFNGTIEFRDVCFRFPDAEEYMLKDISFTARKVRQRHLLAPLDQENRLL